MADRETELRTVAERLRTHDAVDDAFLAKSFTDQLLVVDVAGDGLPEEVIDRLAAHDLHGVNEVYGDDGTRSFAGRVGEGTRHQFVDVRTRGDHQSYVVD